MPEPLALADLVATSAAVAATSSRRAKRDLLADLLRRTPEAEVADVAAYLSGALPQGRIGVGWRSLPRVAPAETATLSVADVGGAFAALAGTTGAGSATRRAALTEELYARATADEQAYLGALLTGTLRQGSLEGPLLAALATAYGIAEATLRRGLMFAGLPGPLAQAAASGGAAAVADLALAVGRAVRPMLAGSAKTVPEAYAAGQVRPRRPVDQALPPGHERFVQAKLDGIRIQVHVRRDPGPGPGEPRVWVFTRSLDDITDRLPEVVELAAALPVTAAVFDGEVLALDAAGRPLPFQVTGARTASTAPPARLRESTPLTAYLFDVLHLDGSDLLDEPLATREALLRAVVPPEAVVPGVRTADVAAAEAFLADVLAAGHEGVVVKEPTSAYAAGRRGSGWTKVKPVRTLDLVVLAVEPGSGRRRGWLSNIHLGARDPTTGTYVMVGKTFKGMTDAMLAWQTDRFGALQTHSDGYVVHLRPEQVVEIALDGVQVSRRYPGGVALRFARVVRYRDDRRAEEVDTIEAVRALGGG